MNAEMSVPKPTDYTIKRVTPDIVGEHVTTGGNVLVKGDIVTHADGDHGLILDYRNDGTELLVVGWAEGSDAWVTTESLEFAPDSPSPFSMRWWANRYVARFDPTYTSDLTGTYAPDGRFGPGDLETKNGMLSKKATPQENQ